MKALVKVAVALAIPLFVSAQNVDVNAYYGKYDITQKVSGMPASSLSVKKEIWNLGSYLPQKSIKLQVIDPNTNDPYWSATNCAIYQHVTQINQQSSAKVSVDFWSAKSYKDLGGQNRKIKTVVNDSSIDGIILGSINYTKNNVAVNASKKPVVAYVNDIQAASLSAKSMVSFYDMGISAASYIKKHYKGEKEVALLALPGPKNSGWADSSYAGLVEGLKNSNVKVVNFVGFGDTKEGTQKMRIKIGLKKHPEVKILWGNAVAASLAIEYLKELGREDIKIVSSYINAPVYEAIKNAKILAAPSDLNVYQAKIAIDMMIRTLNGETSGKDFGFRVSPEIPVLYKGNMNDFSESDLLCVPGWVNKSSL